jgi:hypothetical protein
MAPLLHFATTDWQINTLDTATTQQATTALEEGKILYFPQLAFPLLTEEQPFLSTTYSDGKAKNISYDTRTDELRGTQCKASEKYLLKALLKRFALHAQMLIYQYLPSYKTQLQIARTSYRPIEIAGRKASSYRKDDTRLHVDAFPANPNQGKRILRVFTNINPHGQPRQWRIGEPFAAVAARFAPQIKQPWLGSARLLHCLNLTKSLRTPYDHYMLAIHNQMKGDTVYQQQVTATPIDFPAGTTWIVQTDHVSHAAITGQFVLEQTFYLPVEAMQNPQLSPLYILEGLTGNTLISANR